MRAIALILVVALLPAAAFAQQPPPETPDTTAPAPEDAPPPPLVNAPPTDAPTRTETTPQGPATPPPPGYTPQAPGTGYPYSPYGQKQEPPGPEIGLMFTESAFGMLSSAGTSLLMYYLLIKPMGAQQGQLSGDAATLYNIIFLLGFSAVPMAVAQTELSLANGSRYYYSETWPASLAGLGAQAAVIGLYYLARPNLRDGGEGLLLLGTIVGVPLIEMAVINLTKQPRWKMPGGFVGSALQLQEDGSLHAGVPLPSPLPMQTSTGVQLGLGFSLASGRF